MDPEVIAALLVTAAEGEDNLIATLKSQKKDQETIDAAVANYRVQKGLKDLVDADTMAAVTKSAGYVAVDAPKPAPKPEPAKKSIDLSQLDETTRASIEAVFKSNADLVKKAEETEAVLKSMRDESERKEMVAKAEKEFGHIPMETGELGTMLKSANAVGEEFGKSFQTLLGRMNEMVQKSALLSTIGGGHQPQSGGAMDKIKQLADGMVQKSMGTPNQISEHQAMALVLKTAEGEALYKEYLGDNPAQRARVNY